MLGHPGLTHGCVAAGIVTQLLDGAGPDATTVGISVAAAGMGGAGKTVMALQTYNDDRIKDVFQDRRFWVTLGERPDVVRSQVRLLHDRIFPSQAILEP